MVTFAERVRAEMATAPEAQRLRHERYALVLEWRREGVTMPDIAKRLSVTRARAYQILNEAQRLATTDNRVRLAGQTQTG